METYGEKEWYFFTPRDRKYPKGSKPNRATPTGYWKATGADRNIGSPTIGIKKSLGFFTRERLTRVKTDWIMHEYRLNVERSIVFNNNSRLDDWVLCLLYHKKGKMEIPSVEGDTSNPDPMPPPLPPQQPSNSIPPQPQLKPCQPDGTSGVVNNGVHLEPTNSMTRLNNDLVSEAMNSSGLMQENEVQSVDRPPWEDYEDDLVCDISNDFFDRSDEMIISPLDDIFNFPKE